MFRRIWQKPAKTSVWQQHQTRKKKTEGWVSPSTAGETQRSLLSWSVTSCCSTTLARLPRLPRLASLALCLLAAALARGSAREAEGVEKSDCDVRERRTGKEQQRVRALQQRLSSSVYDIVGTSFVVSFNVSHYCIALTVHLVHQKLVALEHRAAKKLRRTKVWSRQIERKQAAVWNGFPNLISSRVFLVCLFGFVEREK